MAVLRFLARGAFMALVVLVLLGGAAYWAYRDIEGPGPLAAPRTVLIPPHTGISGIGELLADQGVVRHHYVFAAVAGLSARSGALKAGEYEFPAGVSVLQTLDILAGGKTVKHRLTIPEGLTSGEVIGLLRDTPGLEGDPGPPPGEGELLPETYVYSYGEDRKELVERMRRAMAHTVAQLWNERRPNLPLASPQEAVILASIVEKETAREEERPHIAGVFINRLRLGMRLQSDPTVIYAVSENRAAKLDRPLTRADLAVNSPYNTYLVKGLPPGPIANPGKSALRAVIRPERTEDLYFVADNTGGHIFAKTLPEQSRNVALYRRGVVVEPEPLNAGPIPVPLPAAGDDPAAAASAPAASPPANNPAANSPAVNNPPANTAANTAATQPPRGPEPADKQRRCRHPGERGCVR